ncbi:MAG: hypothetical protein IPP94_05150 [Ignavibacteria bacterium]|nr:hypothetical protein [Ignavibacteria bacterium]
MSETRSIPLLGDIPLEYGQRIEHSVDGGFVPLRIAGLDGELQQRLSRRGHRIRICGYLVGDEAASQLETLQNAGLAGEELTFASDITTALDLQKVVITSFRAVEVAGVPGRFSYDISIVESPPLPPPAQLEAFGGLDDFGLGDLGFDTDILGDIADLAGDIAGAIDDALGVLDALSGLSDLDVGGMFDPLQDPINKVSQVASKFGDAISGLTKAFS